METIPDFSSVTQCPADSHGSAESTFISLVSLEQKGEVQGNAMGKGLREKACYSEHRERHLLCIAIQKPPDLFHFCW